MDKKAPHTLNWHYLPLNLELRGPGGVRQSEADVMHQGELAAGTQVAIRGTLHTYVYVIHIDSASHKVTQLYPRGDDHEEQDPGVALRLPAEPQEFLTVPSAGELRVVVSHQPISPEEWESFADAGGRAPPPLPVRR